VQSGGSQQKVPDLKCEVQDLLLEVVDLKHEVPDLRSGGIPLNLTPESDSQSLNIQPIDHPRRLAFSEEVWV